MTTPAVIEVATGTNPASALVEALAATTPRDGGAYRVSVGHDDGCPCIDGRPMADCTCEIVTVQREALG